MSSASERSSRAAGSNATSNTAPGRSGAASESSCSLPVNFRPVTLSTSTVTTSAMVATVPTPTSDAATVRVLRRTGAGQQKRRREPDSDNGENVSNKVVGMPLGSAIRSATEPNFSARDDDRHFYPLEMTPAATAESAIAVMRPRNAVIGGAWRAIGPGVEVLSGDDGGPLRRTVKRILDPLVLRLRSNTQYSAPFVDADVASRCTI